MKYARHRSNELSFVREHVLNVSDLTRTKKLAQILNGYAGRQSDEIYVVQNARNRDGQAVISDLEYFEELLTYKDAVDDAIDELIDEVVIERKDEVADISLAEVIENLGLDVKQIAALSDEVEEEE